MLKKLFEESNQNTTIVANLRDTFAITQDEWLKDNIIPFRHVDHLRLSYVASGAPSTYIEDTGSAYVFSQTILIFRYETPIFISVRNCFCKLKKTISFTLTVSKYDEKYTHKEEYDCPEL